MSGDGSWELEVEALQYTYGQDVTINDPTTVTVALRPFTGEDSTKEYVQAYMRLSITDQYPACPPQVQLVNVKGLSDEKAQQLLEGIREEAECLAGELVVGQLVEVAKDMLTQLNSPEGNCSFCLMSLTDGQGVCANEHLLKLPCFHVFHEGCFVQWWCHQQKHYSIENRKLVERTGQAAAERIKATHLPPSDGPHFLLTCPVCRVPFYLHELDHVRHKLEEELLAGGTWGRAGSCQEAGKLTEAQLMPYRGLQEQQTQLLQRQAAKGGLITEVNYSISSWELPPPESNETGTRAYDQGVQGEPVEMAKPEEVARNDIWKSRGQRTYHSGRARGGRPRRGGRGGRQAGAPDVEGVPRSCPSEGLHGGSRYHGARWSADSERCRSSAGCPPKTRSGHGGPGTSFNIRCSPVVEEEPGASQSSRHTSSEEALKGLRKNFVNVDHDTSIPGLTRTSTAGGQDGATSDLERGQGYGRHGFVEHMRDLQMKAHGGLGSIDRHQRPFEGNASWSRECMRRTQSVTGQGEGVAGSEARGSHGGKQHGRWRRHKGPRGRHGHIGGSPASQARVMVGDDAGENMRTGSGVSPGHPVHVMGGA